MQRPKAAKSRTSHDRSLEKRLIEYGLGIDPSFVNRRLIQSLIGRKGMEFIDEDLKRVAPTMDALYEVRVDHIYTNVLLGYCAYRKAPTLGELLAGDETLVCSTEKFKPCKRVYDDRRVTSIIRAPGNSRMRVEVEYSISHLHGDTLRMLLHRGGQLSFVALVHSRKKDRVVLHPLVIGLPMLQH